MKKSAEEFFREYFFKEGISNEEWEIAKTGKTWVEAAISAMQLHTNQELLAFKQWYDKLHPTDMVSVWSKDGSQQGLFNLTDEQLIEKWNRYQYPKYTKFQNPDAVIDMAAGG